MVFSSPDDYWRLWPLPTVSLERWPHGVESASDRNRLADYLASLNDADALDAINLDPYWAGFWMLNEAERQSWMGAFFHHLQRFPLDSLFSTQVFESFEIPPRFDPRYEVFLQDKKVYEGTERHLIFILMSTGYATDFQDDEWRSREETLTFWSDVGRTS